MRVFSTSVVAAYAYRHTALLILGWEGLVFCREETATCSDKVIFADFQKSAELLTGQTVAVEFLPKQPGEFVFACPMGMFRGRLIVE